MFKKDCFIKNRKRGSVSLFVVIFLTLLISVITISFTRLMIQDQDQATDTDLSNSAYDSALVGVEDAKRALLRYQTLCANGDSDCAKAYDMINSNNCNEAVKGLADVSSHSDDNKEVEVMNNKADSDGDKKLNQAYTCVKIRLNTPNYLGELVKDSSNVISLNSEKSFNAIQIEWYSNEDARGNNYKVSFDSTSAFTLPTSFAEYQPPILRSQIIEFSPNNTQLDSLNTNTNGSSGANTLFLYPKSSGSSDFNLNGDIRKTGTKFAQSVACKTPTTANGGYACKAIIRLNNAVNSANTNAFMRLTSFYSKAQYKVTLLNNTDIVNFNAVQPEIDSTGRADNMFRRVDSRVEMTDINFPYPEAAVDVTGNFCKKFYVTNKDEHYVANNGDCNPSGP